VTFVKTFVTFVVNGFYTFLTAPQGVEAGKPLTNF